MSELVSVLALLIAIFAANKAEKLRRGMLEFAQGAGLLLAKDSAKENCKKIGVVLESKSGDKERNECQPQTKQGNPAI